MGNCEMYEAKKAFEYEECVVCEISRGECPYKNEGHRIECNDGETRIICKTRGSVSTLEKGLLKHIIQQQNPPLT